MVRRRRSLLFLAGNDPSALERGRAAGADALILDLEDTVPPGEKARARRLVAGFLRAPADDGAERIVRVNAATTGDFAEDVAVVVAAGAEALLVPKSASAHGLRAVDERVGAAERAGARSPGAVRLLPLIETAAGIVHAASVATASPRVDALAIGHVDLSRDLGLTTGLAGEGVLLHARCQVVLAARAAGREAIDTVFMDPGDVDGLRAEARQARRLGFAGKLAVDAGQVPVIHEAFTPSSEEIAHARRLVAAFDASVAEGAGLFVFEGRLVDLPVVEAERALLERARHARRT